MRLILKCKNMLFWQNSIYRWIFADFLTGLYQILSILRQSRWWRQRKNEWKQKARTHTHTPTAVDSKLDRKKVCDFHFRQHLLKSHDASNDVQSLLKLICVNWTNSVKTLALKCKCCSKYFLNWIKCVSTRHQENRFIYLFMSSFFFRQVAAFSK